MQSSVSAGRRARVGAAPAGKLGAMRPPSPARVLAVLAAALLTVAASPVLAQWKWKDGTGRVQYSDLPPPQGTPESSILSRPNTRTTVAPRQATAPLPAASLASGVTTTSAPRGVDPELEARRKKAEDEIKAKNKAEEERVAAARAENCKRAQTAQRTLDSGTRIMRTNEKGEREYLDDTQRAQERQRVQQTIASDCR